ncbi:MAG: septation ring formation regulator EzrA [Bacilli bacterium]
MGSATLLMWTYFIVAIILIVIVLNIVQKLRHDKYKKEVETLDREKNLITNIPILQELSRVEVIIKNEKLEEKYKRWNKKYDLIKNTKIPKITDMLLELDFLIEQMDYKNLMYKLVKTEMEVYKVRTKAEFLLNEIKEITLSEEKNRNIITKLKSKYRELHLSFNNNKKEFGDYVMPVELQFENIEKRFQEFEVHMEKNNYDEVSHIVKALDEQINAMELVVDELPKVILMAEIIIPKKIEEVTNSYNRMLKEGFPLDYLNFKYNVEEVEKKVNNISDRCKVLNLEDAILELRTIIDYFESLFSDFENERMHKRSFKDNINLFKNKLIRMNRVMENIYAQLDDIKFNYDLSENETNELNRLSSELKFINSDFDELSEKVKIKETAYSIMAKELEEIALRLSKIEDDLERCLHSLGNMKEDEIRAREQLDEIKLLLRESKYKIRKYKLPVIPNHYFIQLKEAQESIKEIIKELEKKPINIKILNTRVDTARDLVFKLFNTTNEMVKTAMLAERAIMYGNRYKSGKVQVEQGLNNAEILFTKGDYKMALEISINSIDLVEPGIYQRLLEVYNKENN